MRVRDHERIDVVGQQLQQRFAELIESRPSEQIPQETDQAAPLPG